MAKGVNPFAKAMSHHGPRHTHRTQAMEPTSIVKRRLHRIAVVGLTVPNNNGGTEAGLALNTSLGEFNAATQLVQQYEQYRMTNLRIWIRPNAQNLGGLAGPVDKFAACYALNNYSVAEVFLDFDTAVVPTVQETIRRDKLNNIRVNPDGWTKLASFKPRAKLDTNTNSLPAVVFPNSEWLSTEFADITYLGLRGQLKQDSDFWGINTADCARFTVYYTADFEFRGLKSGI